MFKQFRKRESGRIRWHQFTRRSDAIFLSMHREISIGVLSVAALTFAAPASATGKMACGVNDGSHISTTSYLATDDVGDDLIEGEDSLILAGTEVVASRVPISAVKAARLVQVIDRKQIESSAVQSVNDLLKLSAGVDVRQRGAFGIQTDVSVNGGTDDQLTVLLNGVNISNPHTGHLTVDLPVSIDEIERIEVIEGGASRVYGAQAFSGVINIVTKENSKGQRTEGAQEPYSGLPIKRHDTWNLGGGLSAGSFGTVDASLHAGANTGKVSNRLSGGYARSDGGTENSDFKKGNAFYRGKLTTDIIDLNWQAGFSSMNYGANTFYGTGSHSQYEEDRRIMASVGGEYKGRIHILPLIYWNRSLDHYAWIRSNPEAYENFHQTNVYGASVNAYTSWALGKTALGVEWRREEILSTRLGKEVADATAHKVPGQPGKYYHYADGRDNFGIYLEHDILLRDWTVSLGVLANDNSSVDGSFRFYPGVDVSYRPHGIAGVKFYASFNQSLRVATFTDLYYNGPGIKGNSKLQPEKSTDYALGASYSHSLLFAQVKGFFRHGTDMIDWVRRVDSSESKEYTVANSDIDCGGIEASVRLDFNRVYEHYSFLNNITLSYCWIDKYRTNKEEEALYMSNLNYLRHKLVMSIGHNIYKALTAQWDFTVKSRNGEFDNALTGETQRYGTHALLDLKLLWTRKDSKVSITNHQLSIPDYQLYIQANNLLGKHYYDVSNVLQPGFWFMGGVKVML